MTDLQLGLLIVGVIAVVAVLAYNRVLERRERKRLEEGFGLSAQDVLLESPLKPRARERASPDGARERAIPGDARERIRPAPRLEPEEHTDSAGTAAARGIEPSVPAGGSLPDERVDFIVELVCATAVPAVRALELWEPIRHRFLRRALLAGTAGDGLWRGVSLQDPEPYAQLRLGLQLVSRQGATTDSELIEFRALCDAMAAGLEAGIAAPEVRSAGETARALDAVCADADIQIVLHLALPPKPGVEAALRAAALAAGLASDQAGGYSMRGEGGAMLFQAGLGDGRFSLLLDLPRCPDLRNAWQQMLAAARSMSGKLGAGIVDDNGAPLGDAALAGIGSEVERVRVALEQRGVAAGSALALRLFS